jgi:uncharacterized protein (TIGR03435 family)
MNRVCLLIAALAVITSAQKFEVASIKPNKENDHRVMIGMAPGGRFTAHGVTVKQLISMAYGVRDHQLTGLPGWAESERYDISAKPEGAPPENAAPPNRMPSEAEMQTQQEKMRAMMKDLLADRFGLKVHPETKEMPVYALVVAKNGSKLEESKEGAPPIVDFGGRGPMAGGRGPGSDDVRQTRGGPMMRMGRGQITAQDMRMPMLVEQLSRTLGRNVIDKTGLTGKYDVKLNWTPDESQPAAFPGGDGPRTDAATPETGPSLFTAIQEQLGLKLESQKGPVEVIVVDHIEKATEN